ncbi:MAG: hypothetical protein ACLQVF_17640 [Isosphaeraceae bacterium]
MTSILFWNLAKNASVLPQLICLARNSSIDVFLLAESPDDLGPNLVELNKLGRGAYYEAGVVKPTKVRAVTRLQHPGFDHVFTTIGEDTNVWSIKASKVNPPEVLLAVTHLPSKAGGHTDEGQATYASKVAAELAGYEDKRGHCNTVFVGDFNMNPYDRGMTLVDCMHGLMTRELAQRQDREYRKLDYRRFYNPMWGLFGDRTPGPAGTHFWRSSIPHNTHWGMLDQVLLRPVLIPTLAKLEILESDGNHSLIADDGYPDKSYLSDHLPIHFELDI